MFLWMQSAWGEAIPHDDKDDDDDVGCDSDVGCGIVDADVAPMMLDALKQMKMILMRSRIVKIRVTKTIHMSW